MNATSEQMKQLIDALFAPANVPAALTALDQLKKAIEEAEIHLLRTGRAKGISFEELARPLGMTRQSVAERIGRQAALAQFGLAPDLRLKVRKPGSTTLPGFVNPNGQRVERPTNLPGNDHLQRIYVMTCTRCGHEYGANGSDIHLRKCPSCMGGAPGLPF